MAFFSGYPVLYAFLLALNESKKIKSGFYSNLIRLLPFAYALSGTLFFGLILKVVYPDFSARNISKQLQPAFLNIWAILSLLFWIPLLHKKPVFSLIHSLVFFSLVFKDILLNIGSSISNDFIKNDMKMYTISILLNIITLAVLSVLSFIFSLMRKKS